MYRGHLGDCGTGRVLAAWPGAERVGDQVPTRGGNTTNTMGGSQGYGTSESASDSRNRGWQGIQRVYEYRVEQP